MSTSRKVMLSLLLVMSSIGGEDVSAPITRGSEMHDGGGSKRTLAHAVYSRFRRLVRLDALMTARLVANVFVEDLDVVVEALDDGDGGEAQFLFLQSIVLGELLEFDPVAGSVLNPSMDHHLKYLSLMAKLHPEQVYEYLSKHDNYRAEDALKLAYGLTPGE
jgi:hypothetical protein